MKSLKNIFFLMICLSFATRMAYSRPSVFQNPDTLYKKAIAASDLSTGIAIARQACKAAKIHHENDVLINSLNLIATYFWEKGANDSAKFYGLYAIGIANRCRLDSLSADAWMILGLVDYNTGAYDNAIINYKNAIPLYGKKRPLNVAIGYMNIGICESELSRNTEAITHFLTGIKTFEALKDSSNLASSYNQIAVCFASLKNYPKAIEYNRKALAIRQGLHNNKLEAQSLNNMGFAFKEDGKPDSAIFYLGKCLALRKDEKDTAKLVLTLQNLGSAWKMKGNFKKAESYIARSLRIAANYGMKEELARGNLDLAELYTAEKKYKEGLVSAKITEKTAAELKLPQLLMDAYSAEVNLYAQSNDYKNAFFYDGKRNKIKDSLFTTAKNRTINELEIKYQTSQDIKDIIALNSQNRLSGNVVKQQSNFIIVLIIAAVLLLLLFIIAYNSFRIKNNANMRIQTLMQDLHHRVKNNLQILSGLFTMQIDELNDENTKNTLRENESRLISMNLIHNKLYLDHGNTQIEMEDYLTKLLQHIKGSFGGENVSLRTEIEPIMLEADKAVAIGLIVNELATNAFKYAFGSCNGEIYLGLKQQGKSKLLLCLSDNGKGIIKEDEQKAPSFGLKLVNLMARQLNSTLIVKNDKGTVYEMVIGI